MDNVLITEGESDTALMKALVGSGHTDCTRYIAAGGRSSADALARSYLTDPTTKVVVVVDADTSDPNLVEERKRFLQRSLGQIAESTRWHVLVIAPEIERLLFDNRTILEDLLQHTVSEADFIEGKYKPKSVLQKIAGMSKMQLYERLSKIDLGPIRSRPEIQNLKLFFEPKRRKVAA
jgi:hypothetical protein